MAAKAAIRDKPEYWESACPKHVAVDGSLRCHDVWVWWTMAEITDHPLAGHSAWLITDGKIGMDVQVRGVADALQLDFQLKHVAPRQPFRALSPFGPVDPRDKFGAPGTPFAPPYPAIALATGRLSIPYLRALRRRAGPGTYCVVLQDPRTGANTADVIWVPEHDLRRGVNVMTTLTSPHSFSQARLAALRGKIPPAIAALPRPRVALILGGPSGAYSFDEAAQKQLAASVVGLAAHAGSFLITPSRRTPPALTAAIEIATREKPRLLWDGQGENPYPNFLAHADVLVVTADSVNMTGEACATGRPVYVFEPGRGSPKFARFHAALRRHGATRSLPETMSRIEEWTYPPLDSALEIAAEIERRWSRRKAVLPGLMPA